MNKKITTILSTCLLAFCLSSNAASTATVGGTGATYPTLKAAFDAINTGVLTGSITLQLTGSTTETNSASLNASGTGAANYTAVTVYPTVACSITGNLNNNLITLNGADSVTIDGRINQTGSNKSLIITNNSAGNAASTLTLQNSATNNDTKYVVFKGAGVSTDLGVITFLNPGIGGKGNDNNTVEFCDIRESLSPPRLGIYSNGTQGAGGDFNDNNVISDNRIYNFCNSGSNTFFGGIYLKAYNSNWKIQNNHLYHSTTYSTGTYNTMYYLSIEGNSPSLGVGYTIKNNYFGGIDSLGNGTFNMSGSINALKLMTTSSTQSTISDNFFRGTSHTY